MQKSNIDYILENLEVLFPDAGCELNYNNVFELIIAVSLSAQTTDKSVNKITPELFKKYPTPHLLANAKLEDVEEIIKSIGLYKNKSKNIINLSKILVEKFNGIVPNNQNDLESLPGVGRKTANVVLTEGFKIPRIPVDTHVDRVSKRFGLIDDKATVLDVENKLMSLIEKSKWHKAHHLLLFMGRYKCLAKNPKCSDCFYKENCKYDKKPLN